MVYGWPCGSRAARSRSRFSASGRWLSSAVFGSVTVTIVVGTNETGDVVYVAMGIVSGYAAIHPQHLVDAEIVVEDTLQIFAAKARIALLHVAQQALFSGDQRALGR